MSPSPETLKTLIGEGSGAGGGWFGLAMQGTPARGAWQS